MNPPCRTPTVSAAGDGTYDDISEAYWAISVADGLLLKAWVSISTLLKGYFIGIVFLCVGARSSKKVIVYRDRRR